MEEYIIYFGLGFLVLAGLSIIRDIFTLKRDTIRGEVIRCKNKTNKGKRYCYPKVDMLELGFDKEFFVYSARKKGHDYYIEGDILDFYPSKNLFGKDVYRCTIGFWNLSITLISISVLTIIASFVL